MQPDVLSVQREDEQSEFLSAQELTQSEPLSIPDSTPAVSPPPAIPAKRTRSRLNFAAIGLSLLVFLLLLGLGWVGYWAYTLNTDLMTTQGQFAALQADHTKLQAEYTTLKSDHEKLNADLTQSRADLEKANTDLTTTQADLDKSKDENKLLNEQIETAESLAEILYVTAMWDSDSDILKIDRLITEAANQSLTKQWDTFTNSPSEDAFTSFFEYLIFATRESLR
jgi:cell division protein FtsB